MQLYRTSDSEPGNLSALLRMETPVFLIRFSRPFFFGLFFAHSSRSIPGGKKQKKKTKKKKNPIEKCSMRDEMVGRQLRRDNRQAAKDSVDINRSWLHFLEALHTKWHCSVFFPLRHGQVKDQ